MVVQKFFVGDRSHSSWVLAKLIPYRQLTYRHKPTGHIKVMPDSMDVIVLSKLEDGNIEVFSKSKLYK